MLDLRDGGGVGSFAAVEDRLYVGLGRLRSAGRRVTGGAVTNSGLRRAVEPEVEHDLAVDEPVRRGGGIVVV